ncbi:MAG: tRNA pseudouridine(55) synthase TruB, partial [Gemmatimonadota bacterium]|nr:tRNA pseudouridine(55) synthase TruB [Gemmatimonadota bacterium]
MTGSRPDAGILLVDKPVGPTSHDVVDVARRALGIRKVGHTGTLDPFASGLLVLCIGKATRVAEFLVGLDKRYDAEATFGLSTDTGDRLGEELARDENWKEIPTLQVERVLDGLKGSRLQT